MTDNNPERIKLVEPEKQLTSFKVTITIILIILAICFYSSVVYFQSLLTQINYQKNKDSSQQNYNCIKEIILDINGFDEQKLIMQYPCSVSIVKSTSSTVLHVDQSSILIKCTGGCPP